MESERRRVRLDCDEWTDEQRRDERARLEEIRRAMAADVPLGAWQEQQRQNELTHGELTERFLENLHKKAAE